MKFFRRGACLVVLLPAMAGLAIPRSRAQTQPGAKDETRDAGHAVKKTTKKAGHQVKQTSKKATHKAAKTTRKGAEKVENKTETQ